MEAAEAAKSTMNLFIFFFQKYKFQELMKCCCCCFGCLDVDHSVSSELLLLFRGAHKII